mmetsp:Transcript_68774/g.120443  ORF Transcript_68774/g.120443 Transcript_68774/m.120443 type:complete len:121 (+) Transcript_68774:95-457(+)
MPRLSKRCTTSNQGKLTDKEVTLEGDIAKARDDHSEELTLKNENEGLKTKEEKYHSEIKPDCDWIIGAFDKRAEARAAEMTGLTQAKEYLAGAQSSLLQQTARGSKVSRHVSRLFLSLRH